MKPQLRRKIAFGLRGFLSLFLLAQAARAQVLALPPRPADALTGSVFAQSLTNLARPEREEKIYQQIALGNVPDFLRLLCPVQVEMSENGKTNSAIFYVTPDYLAVGCDTNYFFTPLTPITAQRVADLAHCSLPTRKMVDMIYSNAVVKLAPFPILPNAAMTTVPIFIEHNYAIANQREASLPEHPLGALVAGDKKDVVISAKLAGTSGKVAIYGWHKLDGHAIQPLYLGHTETWADYSHGIRLVQMEMTVNGKQTTVATTLADPALCELLSDEGPIGTPRYPTTFKPVPVVASATGSDTNHEAK
ncbi:MAG TPA: hypothetical protein VH413_19930 [Verrucomicrobiae bacterium]|nr:hypothetical protein [Verrucomicrobiae bacterium]